MKKIGAYLLIFLLLTAITGCTPSVETDIVATTGPVWEFTQLLCAGTGLCVTQLITQPVSCVHDYTLQTSQMRAVEGADTVIINGAGLEDFMDNVLSAKETVIDASAAMPLQENTCSHTQHDAHLHGTDAHFWLSPDHAAIMAKNICNGLIAAYPQHRKTFEDNYELLAEKLLQLKDYGKAQLQELSCRELITFHDGFSYFAKAFDLTVLASIEEQSGSEASAATLAELSSLISDRDIPALFTEENGSASAAKILANETGAHIYTLRMGLAGSSYFEAMYHNIDTVKEALG